MPQKRPPAEPRAKTCREGQAAVAPPHTPPPAQLLGRRGGRVSAWRHSSADLGAMCHPVGPCRPVSRAGTNASSPGFSSNGTEQSLRNAAHRCNCRIPYAAKPAHGYQLPRHGSGEAAPGRAGTTPGHGHGHAVRYGAGGSRLSHTVPVRRQACHTRRCSEAVLTCAIRRYSSRSRAASS